MKDVGLRIRIQRDLREAFLEACRAQDKPAAQVLREFMRDFVARQSHGTERIAVGDAQQEVHNNKRQGKREDLKIRGI